MSVVDTAENNEFPGPILVYALTVNATLARVRRYISYCVVSVYCVDVLQYSSVDSKTDFIVHNDSIGLYRRVPCEVNMDHSRVS